MPHLPARLRHFRIRAIHATLLLAILLVSIPAGQTPFAASERGGSAVVKGRLLAINDFHGALDPPVGSAGLFNGTPVGGVEYLATLIKQLRATAEGSGEHVFTVAAGDLVGASPLLSAAFHDEGAIEALSELGLDLSSVGNHEFDEGLAELRRLQRGGCHPADGCQAGTAFAGADFQYLAANVVDRRTRLPIFPPVSIKLVQGVPIGFVGVTLKSTLDLVNPAGVQSLEVLDEAQTANFYAALLRLAGIRSLVLLIHEGGAQQPLPSTDPSGCAGFTGPIVGIVTRLREEFGIVASGHTHRAYVCSLPNASGRSSVVTSAGSMGQLVTSIGFTIDKRTWRFASVSAENVLVENGVQLPDGSWARDAAGNFVRNPDLVDPDVKQIVDKYRVAVAPIANRVVGSITADITRATVPSGESPMGDVIADALLAYTTAAGAQIALMNPGGIRADLFFASSPGGEAPGQVTYGEAFTVQPFNQLVLTETLTGAQLKAVLEQQFAGVDGQTAQRILQVSTGFTYTLASVNALENRISDMRLNGVPIDPAASYRVTITDFLAAGGDGFSRLAVGTQRVVAPGFDVDALVAYLGAASPVPPGPANRITKVN